MEVGEPHRHADAVAGVLRTGRFDRVLGRVLELNTVLALHASVLGWWHDAGGQAVAFGSDAHDPAAVARGFRDAARLAGEHGFRAGHDPHDFWVRAG